MANIAPCRAFKSILEVLSNNVDKIVSAAYSGA